MNTFKCSLLQGIVTFGKYILASHRKTTNEKRGHGAEKLFYFVHISFYSTSFDIIFILLRDIAQWQKVVFQSQRPWVRALNLYIPQSTIVQT